jgi:MFS family permease
VSTSPTAARPLTLTAWLIVIMAAIGFAFDIYELLMLPLVLRPAILELGKLAPADPGFADYVATWRALMFYVPAVAGGVFGLLGGYLTDILGRRRVLTWSILLYSVSAFLAGYSTSLPMLLVLRSAKFIGVCVEFVAAIAWLAELFPEPKQRERVLGYTQAFSSFGGLLVAIANSLAIALARELPAVAVPAFAASWWGTIGPEHQHEPWRYTFLSGLIPAIPLVLIRPFLPESPAWQSKKAAGTLKRPSLTELFAPAFRRTTLVTTLMFACSYGVAFGAIQQIPEMVPGLANVKEAAADQPLPKKRLIEQKTAADYTKVQEIGGLVGRFLLAILAVRIVSRRALLRVFLVPSLFVIPLVFYFFLTVENRTFFVIPTPTFVVNGEPVSFGTLPITTVSLGVFVAGLLTVAQFSFWGNYLPRVYPVHLRGTGESVAANVGGRMIGTGFAAVTSFLAAQPFVPGGSDPAKYAITAAAVALGVIVVGLLASFFLPEPSRESDD